MAVRTKIRDRVLPDYTRGEEIFNMSSHISGGAFGIAALVICVVTAALRGNVWNMVSGAIFGVSTIILYAMSSIYHGLLEGTTKKVFQVIDHCAIFLLIAGSYTPLALGQFRVMYPVISWSLFAFIWGMCALGMTLNAIDLKRFKVFSMVCYIALGWSLLIFTKQLLTAIPLSSFVLLLTGGVSYTIGSVLYLLGKKRRYMHSIFHMFVLAGSIQHFACVLISFLA